MKFSETELFVTFESCEQKLRTQIICWRRNWWNHKTDDVDDDSYYNNDSNHWWLFSETVHGSNLNFFIEYSKTKYEVCTTPVVLFWRWVWLMCSVCCSGGRGIWAGLRGAGPLGRIHDIDTEVRLNWWNTRNSFTSLINNNRSALQPFVFIVKDTTGSCSERKIYSSCLSHRFFF